MITEYTTLEDFKNNKKQFNSRNQFYKTILEFLASEEEVLVFKFDNKMEARTAYQTIYGNSVRRHQLPIKRFIRGNDVYVIRAEADNE